MPQFFQPSTQILYTCDDKPAEDAVSVEIATMHTLRRMLAGSANTIANSPVFFSTKTHTLHSGTYDLNHETNRDLILVKQTISQ